MALLKPEANRKKGLLRARVEMGVMDMAKEYATFAGMAKVDEFYQMAAKYIFEQDKDFQRYLEKKHAETDHHS